MEQWNGYNVHDASKCEGQVCIVHNPTDHHMRDWPLHWRSDTVLFERTCKHSTGHPDPDQYDFFRSTGEEWKMIHGCCGCCISAGWAAKDNPLDDVTDEEWEAKTSLDSTADV